MKNKDIYYALIAFSVLGVISKTFELFSSFISSVIITSGVFLLVVFYLSDIIYLRKESEKKSSYKFWKYFNLVSLEQMPIKKSARAVSYGTEYRYLPPIGISSEKFKSKNLEIKEHTKADKIDINYDKGDIIISVYHSKNQDVKPLI